MQELNADKQRISDLIGEKAVLESEFRNAKELYSEDELKKMRQHLEDGNVTFSIRMLHSFGTNFETLLMFGMLYYRRNALGPAEQYGQCQDLAPGARQPEVEEAAARHGGEPHA